MTDKNLKEDFPGNSKASRIVPMRPKAEIREEGEMVVSERKARKTIKGHALRRKKSLTQSIAQSFLGEETRSVGQHILYEVLIPAAKTTIQDMIESGISMLLFGETRSHGRSRDKGTGNVSYGKFFRGNDRPDNNAYDPRSRMNKSGGGRFDLDDIFFKHGDEASEVLEGLCNLLEEYDQVTVADFFELADIDGANWTHTKWGWTDLSRAKCTHTRYGYAIMLPRPIELD